MLIDAALLFALGTALAYAFADVTARFGLQRADPLVGAMMALTRLGDAVPAGHFPPPAPGFRPSASTTSG